MKITIKDNFTAKAAEILADRTNKAKHILALQVQKDTEPFVPMLTGTLNTETRVVGDTIIYPPPYSRFLYYGKVMVDPQTGSAWARYGVKKVVTEKDLVYTTDFHPNAGAAWVERSAAQNKERWLEVAQEVMDNGKR